MYKIDIEKYKNEYADLNSTLADPSKIDSRELGALF